MHIHTATTRSEFKLVCISQSFPPSDPSLNTDEGVGVGDGDGDDLTRDQDAGEGNLHGNCLEVEAE